MLLMSLRHAQILYPVEPVSKACFMCSVCRDC